MKRIGSILRRLFTVSLLGSSILCLLLMVILSYNQTCYDAYSAVGTLPEILPLPGLPASSLLNSGDLTALDDLPGIGEKRLADIMAYLAEQPTSPTDLEASP